MELSPQHDYYELLGVSRNATEEEIRRAYARRRRELEQKRDLEQINLLLRAKETLSDQIARKHYDAILEFGGYAQQLHERALEAIKNQDLNEAASCLKRILAVIPTAEAIWYELAEVQLSQQNYTEAFAAFEKLLAIAPKTALYWRRAAAAHLEASKWCVAKQGNPDYECDIECPACGQREKRYFRKRFVHATCRYCGTGFPVINEPKSAYLEKSRGFLQKAIDMAPTVAEAYMLTALSYVHEGEMDKAVKWAERGILADDKVDIQDLDDLIWLCHICILADKRQLLREKVFQIMSLSDDLEYRNHLVQRFILLALTFLLRGSFAHASTCITCAEQVDPTHDALIESAQHIHLLGRVESEYHRAINDTLLPECLKLRFTFVLLSCIPEEGRKDINLDDLMQGCLQALRQTPLDKVRSGLLRLRHYYPSYCTLDEEFLRSLEDAAQSTPKVAGGGCLLACLFFACGTFTLHLIL